MNRNLMFSSKNNAWCTPQDFFDKLNAEFNFTLDPCSTEISAKCGKFYTVDDDGLSQDWGTETVFVNPPYGREIGKWVKKSYEASLGGALVVMLIPSRTDTRWWHDYIQDRAIVRFIKGRLKFVNLDSPEPRKMSPAPFPSVVVIFIPSINNKYK